MTPLCHLAEKYGTDKFSKHRYTQIYFELIGARAASVWHVLEIGIKRGASLRMWEEFFPRAAILGIDSKHKNLITEGRIRSAWGDQSRPSTLVAAVEGAGPFDLIVDDGSHAAWHQTTAMVTLIHYLAPGGVYVIEDVKHGPNDQPETIVAQVPAEFESRMVLTTAEWDSGLLVIQRR